MTSIQTQTRMPANQGELIVTLIERIPLREPLGMGTSEMRGSGQSLLPGAKACHCFSARTNRTTHEWGTEVGGRPVLGCCRGLEAARTRLGRPNFAPRRHVGLRAQRRLLWQLPRPSAVWTFVATLGDERHLMRPSDLGSLRSADPTVKMIHARENKPNALI